MAAKPYKSAAVTATTDVNLDFLTKEEREALLSQKMDMIRQRNKALSERHQLISIGQVQKMIEADKRQAEEAGQAVKPQDRQPAAPAEGTATPKAKGRGRGQSQGQGHAPGHQGRDAHRPKTPVDHHRPKTPIDHHRPKTPIDHHRPKTPIDHRPKTPNKERPKSSGNFRDSNYNEPSMKFMEAKNRGHGGQRNRTKSYNREEDAPLPLPHSGSFEYEPIIDMSDLDHRFGRLATSNSYHSFTNNDSNNNINNNNFNYNNNNKEERSWNNNNNNTRPAKLEHKFPLDLKITIANPTSTPHHSSLDKSQGRSDRAPQSQNQRDRENRGERSGRRREGGRDRPKSFPNDQPPPSPAYEGRLKGDLGPPPDPSWNPLADSRRQDKRSAPATADQSQGGQGSEMRAEGRREQRRHPQNYGGGADLAKVKQIMKTQREKEKEAPPSPRPLDMVMTGRERRSHEEWRRERERCDRERIQRQRNDEGAWRRAWDVDKGDYDDSVEMRRHEPAKRPVGRIGSGRFDRGERDERPHSATLITGPLQMPPSPASSSEAPSSPLTLAANEGRGGKGRARGKGRGRGRPTAATGGDKSPRPRTWSGCEDGRLVVEGTPGGAHQQIMVQFDNTPGDNSVEVEYDGLAPPSPPPTTPGRGPTGRTPQGGQSGGPRGKRGKSPMKPLHKGGKKMGGGELDDEGHLTELPRLNPDAPEFLPTSPDFHTTPTSNMKVMAWPSDPHNPNANMSHSDLTSPRSPGVRGSQGGSPASSVSSPGSSASQKAIKRREENERRKEESDSLPAGDQPWQPPPFLLESVAPPVNGSKKGSPQGKKKKTSAKKGNNATGTNGVSDKISTAKPATKSSSPDASQEAKSKASDSADTSANPSADTSSEQCHKEGKTSNDSVEDQLQSTEVPQEEKAGSSGHTDSVGHDTSDNTAGKPDSEVNGDAPDIEVKETTSDDKVIEPSPKPASDKEVEETTSSADEKLEVNINSDKEVKDAACDKEVADLTEESNSSPHGQQLSNVEEKSAEVDQPSSSIDASEVKTGTSECSHPSDAEGNKGQDDTDGKVKCQDQKEDDFEDAQSSSSLEDKLTCETQGSDDKDAQEAKKVDK